MIRLVDDLRSFAATAVPRGMTVVVTVTAPIRLPGRTAEAIQERIAALVATGGRDRKANVHGNRVRIRIGKSSSKGVPRLLGFVHNPGADLAPVWEAVL